MKLVRILWLAIFALVVVLYVRGIPVEYAQLHRVCPQQMCDNWILSRQAIAGLPAIGLSLDGYAWCLIVLDLISAIVWLGLGALMYLRMRSDRMAIVAAFVLGLFRAGTYGGIINALGATSATWKPAVTLVEFLGQFSVIFFFLVFPDGGFVPRWTIWLLPVAAAVTAVPLLPAAPVDVNTYTQLSLVGYAALVAIQIYRYRRVSGPEERRRTRWVLFGGSIAFAGIAAMQIGVSFLPVSGQSGPLASILQDAGWYALLLTIPISIAVAISRYQLWDIDALINRTLVYGSLTLSLIGLYILAVISLQALFRTLTGQSSDLAIAISTLVVAALFNPWRRRLQTFIDRRFYRRKYDATRTLHQLQRRLRDDLELTELKQDMLTLVHETMQPVSLALWLRDDASPEGKT